MGTVVVWTIYQNRKRSFGLGYSRKPKGASIVGEFYHPYVPEDGITDMTRWVYRPIGNDTQPDYWWLLMHEPTTK